MTDRGPGLFVTFEGADGGGKTTQLRRLAARLRALGADVLETVEPGGTPIGTKIRQILLDKSNAEMDRHTELLLYFAARAQNVHQWIVPHLARGGVVLCDRFTDSTLAYQGAGRGFGEDTVMAVHRVACGTLLPDVTVYLDIDSETGLARVRSGRGKLDRMDDQSLEFHRAVRAGYLRLAAAEPQRIVTVDASPSEDEVERAVWAAIEPRWERTRVR